MIELSRPRIQFDQLLKHGKRLYTFVRSRTYVMSSSSTLATAKAHHLTYYGRKIDFKVQKKRFWLLTVTMYIAISCLTFSYPTTSSLISSFQKIFASKDDVLSEIKSSALQASLAFSSETKKQLPQSNSTISVCEAVNSIPLPIVEPHETSSVNPLAHFLTKLHTSLVVKNIHFQTEKTSLISDKKCTRKEVLCKAFCWENDHKSTGFFENRELLKWEIRVFFFRIS